MSRALLGCRHHPNTRRRLEEVARELIYRIAESDNAPGHTTPLDVEGVYNRTDDIS